MIEFQNISKAYDDGTLALQNVNFNVPKGEFCVLLGHSGAGKSTLLNLVSGLTFATSGNVQIDGKILTERSLKSLRKNVSMIHQNFNLALRSSVATNVMSGALSEVPFLQAITGWFPKSIRNKCCDLLAMVGLEQEHLHRRAYTLSGGQQQRVGIARSLILDPLIILADEPIASLDPIISRETLSILRNLAKIKGCTVLCSLHQVELAKDYADRIIGIEEGQVVFDLLPSEVDQQTLNLIYKNYDDPRGNEVWDQAKIKNVVKSLGHNKW